MSSSPAPTDALSPETLRFAAPDGWMLEADVFRGEAPTCAVLISAGTGFPRRFYHAIAQFLAQRGAVVMVYDYRGIGGSGADNLATSDIDYPDWGRLDLPAAIDALEGLAPGLPITHLAHSVGGHFIGLAPNHAKIRRHAFVSVGTGYWGGHHLKNIPLELAFWWVIGPLALMRHGYVARGGGWMGEPLPPKVFRTWRRWAHRKAYFRPDIGTRMTPDHYGDVTSPIRSWIFPDDPIATPGTAKELMKSYPSAPCDIVLRTPAEIGVRHIGHDGAMRKGREQLWAEIWDWVAAA